MSHMSELHATLTTETTTTTLVAADMPASTDPDVVVVNDREVRRLVRAEGHTNAGNLPEVLSAIGLALEAWCVVTITTTPPQDEQDGTCEVCQRMTDGADRCYRHPRQADNRPARRLSLSDAIKLYDD